MADGSGEEPPEEPFEGDDAPAEDDDFQSADEEDDDFDLPQDVGPVLAKAEATPGAAASSGGPPPGMGGGAPGFGDDAPDGAGAQRWNLKTDGNKEELEPIWQGMTGDREHIKVSKMFSYVLRHAAHKLDVNIRKDGFVRLREIMKLRNFKPYSLEELMAVVYFDEKERYSLVREFDGELLIRANQGHTLKVVEDDLLLEPITDPLTVQDCVHGTYLVHWPFIKRQGLSKVARNHIHLANGLPEDGKIRGMRQTSELFVYVDVPAAMDDGVVFYRSKNEVILTQGVDGWLPPKYFVKAVRIDYNTCDTEYMDFDRCADVPTWAAELAPSGPGEQGTYLIKNLEALITNCKKRMTEINELRALLDTGQDLSDEEKRKVDQHAATYSELQSLEQRFRQHKGYRKESSQDKENRLKEEAEAGTVVKRKDRAVTPPWERGKPSLMESSSMKATEKEKAEWSALGRRRDNAPTPSAKKEDPWSVLGRGRSDKTPGAAPTPSSTRGLDKKGSFGMRDEAPRVGREESWRFRGDDERPSQPSLSRAGSLREDNTPATRPGGASTTTTPSGGAPRFFNSKKEAPSWRDKMSGSSSKDFDDGPSRRKESKDSSDGQSWRQESVADDGPSWRDRDRDIAAAMPAPSVAPRPSPLGAAALTQAVVPPPPQVHAPTASALAGMQSPSNAGGQQYMQAMQPMWQQGGGQQMCGYGSNGQMYYMQSPSHQQDGSMGMMQMQQASTPSMQHQPPQIPSMQMQQPQTPSMQMQPQMQYMQQQQPSSPTMQQQQQQLQQHGMSHKPEQQQQAMSEMNTTIGNPSEVGSRAQLGFERRLAWLEEDVSVLHRRLRDECSEGGPGGAAAGDQGLRALVMRLDAELSSEHRAREGVEAKLASFQDALHAHRRELEAQMHSFSAGMEGMMGTLVDRIDRGLSNGAATLRLSTEETEVRLRNLMATMDQGSSAADVAPVTATGRRSTSPRRPVFEAASAASPLANLAHRSSISAPVGSIGGRLQHQAQEAPGQPGQHRVGSGAVGTAEAVGSQAEQLMESYDRLRQENAWLRDQRARMHGAAATPGGGVTPSATPSLAYPSTLQVPGSGLGQGLAPPYAGGLRSSGATSPVTLQAQSATSRLPSAPGGPVARKF
mmetsp:Transcript_66473/g.168428  ORF Transcript_66473/g.168428 Transcript_66473/m.168428 type:complete len:1131 (+) Transcript_66473:109-3501(+)